MSMLHFLRYVRSFSDGRVRIRHPALRRATVVATAEEKLKSIDGVRSTEFNTLSGSVLILYDSDTISKDRLLEIGEAWAVYLDAAAAGQAAQPPQF